MTLSRRALLLALPVVTLACSAPAAPLHLAAGEPGGFYAEFGELLEAVGRDSGLSIDALTTGGSRSNVDAVASGAADVGLALTDLVAAARSGTDPFTAPVELVAIGRVYENYLQLAVRAESPYRTLADLSGRRVSLGAPGSGATLTSRRLVAAAGVALDARELSLADAANALDARAVDALFWSGGVPTPAIAALAARRPIRLLPLDGYLPDLRARSDGASYSGVTVPIGVYGAPDAVPTVGVANLLVTSPRLPDAAAGELARLLVERAPELVPTSALGTQYLDPPALVDTADVPLHPGAAAAYRALHG